MDNESIKSELRKDAALQEILKKMSPEVQASFSERQLADIKLAVSARTWGSHLIDLRSTIRFFRYRYYFVFLVGRNRRQLTARELRIGLLLKTTVLTVFLSFCVLLGLLVLYLIKSAAGIDIFPNFSLGIWSWFRQAFLP
jgi:hypothetical protein